MHRVRLRKEEECTPILTESLTTSMMDSTQNQTVSNSFRTLSLFILPFLKSANEISSWIVADQIVTSFYSDDSSGAAYAPQASLLSGRSSEVTSSTACGNNGDQSMFYQHLDVEKEMQNLALGTNDDHSNFGASSRFFNYSTSGYASSAFSSNFNGDASSGREEAPRRSRLAAKFDLSFQEPGIN